MEYITRLCLGTLFVSISNVCLFAKFEMIPLSSAQGLTYMASNILFILVGKLILKDTVHWRQAFGMILCMIGSALIILGLTRSVHFVHSLENSHFHRQNSTEVLSKNSSVQETHLSQSFPKRHHHTTTMQYFLLGIGMSVLQGLTDVMYLYCSKTLNDHVDHILILHFWYLIGSILFSSLLMIGFERNRMTLPTQVDDIAFLTTYSLASAIALILNIIILTLLSFLTIGIFLNLEIPLAMLCQYLIVPQIQPIRGGVFDLCGSVLITIGLMLPSLGELWQWKCKRTHEQDDEDHAELIPLSKSE